MAAILPKFIDAGTTKVVTDFQQSVLAASFTTSTAGYEDTGLVVTVTVASTSDLVDFSLMGWGNASISQVFLVAYKVDSGTTQLVMQVDGATGDSCNLSFRNIITGLSAGTHTIKIQIKAATGTATLRYHGTDNEVPTLNALVLH